MKDEDETNSKKSPTSESKKEKIIDVFSQIDNLEDEIKTSRAMLAKEDKSKSSQEKSKPNPLKLDMDVIKPKN